MATIRYRRLLAVATCMLAVAMLFSCSRDPIRLGFISGLTGGNADLGEAGRNGAIIAVDEINRGGGIRGRNIELIVRDDGYLHEKAVAATRELIDMDVAAIIGAFTSSMTESVMSVAAPAGMLVLSPTATAQQLVGKDDSLIRLNSSAQINAGDYADFMYEKRQFRRVSIIIDMQNSLFTESWYDEYRKKFMGLGGEIIDKKAYDSRTKIDFERYIEEVLSLNPDVVLIIANSVDSARIAQQLRKVDESTPVVVAEWAGTQQLIELGGKAVEGIEVMQNVDEFGVQDRFLIFRDEYLRRFNSYPSFSSIIAYESVMVFAEAYGMKKRSQTLKDAVLAGSPYEGLQQQIVFNEFGDMRRNSTFVIIKDRHFRPAE